MSTTRLHEHAKKLAEFAQQSEAAALLSPSDPWARIVALNKKRAAEDALHAYSIRSAEETGQLIDFRFVGARADGSIPLDVFLRIFDPISRALKSVAHKILTGSEDGKILPVVSDHLNLKLAAITSGSTRILVSGSVAPDLAGESLLKNTLQASFRLLNAPNDEIFEAIGDVGGKSASIFHEVMRAIESAGFGAEFSWISPTGREAWRGTPDEVIRLKTLLDGVAEPTTYEEILTGQVSKLFDSGKIELRSGDDRIPISYPLSMIEHVRRLSISSPARLRVITSQYYDAIRQRDVFKRQLVELLS